METLYDPRFEFPDLIAICEAMVAGLVTPEAALAAARCVTAGHVRDTSIGPARVIGPTASASQILRELQEYSNRHRVQSLERWASFALMVEAQLGTGDVSPDAAYLGLGTAMRMIDGCLAGTGGTCPPDARRFIHAAIDSMMANPACDPKTTQRLGTARAAFG